MTTPTDAGRELAKIIDANWFVEAPPGEPRIPPRWNFEDSIREISLQCLQLLLELHFTRIAVAAPANPSAGDVEDIRRGEPIQVASLAVSSADLVATLRIIALSEHRIDSFHYCPSDLQQHAIAELATSAHVDRDELMAFDSKWHAGLRHLVYSNGGDR